MLGWCLYLASSLKLLRGVRQIYANGRIDASAEFAGFPFAYGVFQDHYSRLPEFEGNNSLLPAIGTTTTGIMYFGAPIVYSVCRRWPRFRKISVIAGFVVIIASLIGASFSTTPFQLLATQGILYGIGGAAHYFPAFLYLDEWFFARRGTAYGIVWAGGGAAGLALPLTMQWILSEYGFRTALRVWAVTSIILATPAIFFLKGRLPTHHASTGPQKVEIGFLKDPAFWIFLSGNIVQGLGYFLPTYYMPSFARAVGLKPIAGTIAVSLTNVSTMLGSVIAGWFVDRYHVTTGVNICILGTLISIFLFWGFAIYAPMLYIFAILYGIFAGGFASTWAGVIAPLKHKCPNVETGMVVTLFAAGKGLGSVISGPLSGALVDADGWSGRGGFAWGSGYGLLIVFTGCTAAAQIVGWFGKQAGFVK
ncbi:putative MFS monocarboxylate transporter [Aureobasidium pullulans]|uniref:MFS monocarboxylate transporter n=1 Tax=Aureobasidium pullulans TaxID=5580 RepID=A0AB74JN62_AURPU|nr:putative MFS monocarboxylate transporter [Aureobasidium pullulans]THX36567.1 putative MFS monocarboxylate transporter [Aureobasidium pullulans]TIA38712.1 putative MFS monocarboxylate transporter [Aureobasidium pullulans]